METKGGGRRGGKRSGGREERGKAAASGQPDLSNAKYANYASPRVCPFTPRSPRPSALTPASPAQGPEMGRRAKEAHLGVEAEWQE